MSIKDFLNDDLLKKNVAVTGTFMIADVITAVAVHKSICKDIDEASEDNISEKDFKRICRKIFAKMFLSGIFMTSVLPEIQNKCLDKVLNTKNWKVDTKDEKENDI